MCPLHCVTHYNVTYLPDSIPYSGYIILISISAHFSVSARAVTCQRPPMLHPNSCLISYFNSVHVRLFSVYKPAYVVVRPQSEYQLSSNSFFGSPLGYTETKNL